MHPKHIESERLGREITELCGHLYAATYRLLMLIGEFDAKGGWELPGLVSCAHWLNYKCGIGMHAAREKVRVARALKGLPSISAGAGGGRFPRPARMRIERSCMRSLQHVVLQHARNLGRLYLFAQRYGDSRVDGDVAAKRSDHCDPELLDGLSDGASFVYSGDAVRELARDCDVLVHMCHFLSGTALSDEMAKRNGGHLEVASLAAEANVRNLVVSHITEQMDVPGIRERVIREMAGIYPGNIFIGEDLMEIPVAGPETAKLD